MMLLEMLVGAVLPAIVESGKQWVSTKLGGVKATTVDEQIKLDQNEIEKLTALAKLDNPGGTPSQWVIDLRGSSRYVASFVVILGGVGLAFTPGIAVELVALGLEAANIAFGFLFGSRIQSLGFKK